MIISNIWWYDVRTEAGTAHSKSTAVSVISKPLESYCGTGIQK